MTTSPSSAAPGKFERPTRAAPLEATIIFIGVVVGLIDGFDWAALAMVVPHIAEEWSLPHSSFKWALSASIFGVAVGSLLFGHLGDRIGRRPIIIGATLVVGTATLATVLVQSVMLLFVFRFVVGVSLGACTPNLLALLAEYSSERRHAFALTLAVSCVALGGSAAGLVAPSLVAAFGWPSVFVFGAGLAFVLAAGLAMKLPESYSFLATNRPGSTGIQALRRRLGNLAPDAQVTSGKDSGGISPFIVFRRPALIATFSFWLLWGLCGFVFYLLTSWLVAYLSEAGAPPDRASYSVSLLYLGSVAGGITLSWVYDRAKRKSLVFVLSFAAAVPVLLGFSAAFNDAELWVPAALLLGASTGGVLFMMPAIGSRLYGPTLWGTGLGWSSAIARVIGTLGPLAGGWASAAGLDVAHVLALLIVPVLLCVIFSLIYFHQLSRGVLVDQQV